MVLPQSFYKQKTLKVAQDLLGCFLMRKKGGRTIKTIIVETEAYNGPQDLASHASRGQTPRNRVMFGPPGIIYVYLIYGMHHMLNIVTEKDGYPAAILIRALELTKTRNLKLEIRNFSGPAKLCHTLKIDKSFNGLPVYTKKHGLWIEGRNKKLYKSQIVKVPRVGVDYAREYKEKLWRFYTKDNKCVSKK